MLSRPPVTPGPADRALIESLPPSSADVKNISYRPHVDRVCGLGKTTPSSRARLAELLRHFSQAAIERAAHLLPRYSRSWNVGYASLRPIEDAGRKLPFRKRNDLLHLDAFPSRPTRGGLIVRLFVKVNASLTRVWRASSPFETVARRHARAAGLDASRAASALCEACCAPSDCSRSGRPMTNSCWHFTDSLHGPGPAALLSGQFALEQTFLVPCSGLAEPNRAPISILENIAGRSLD